LSSDTVWDKTHQIGSILFMASGAFAILGGMFGGMTAFWLVFVPLIGSTLFLVVYSYVLYRDETKV
ncbi:MAG TPA: SdpI family protein, partial [Anaerolineales bacterium]|nr:SdpI family protein [Anaerolineales bacterium]